MIGIGVLPIPNAWAFLEVKHLRQWLDSPPTRHQPQLGFFERIREERGGGCIHAFGYATFHLGADGGEINEPRLEQWLSDGFEGSGGFSQECDAVIEGTENTRKTFLHL